MLRHIHIEFVGLSDGEAERKAEGLLDALAKADSDIPVERIPDARRQSAGVVLAVMLGVPTVLIVAATIESFIGRDGTTVRISAKSRTIFEGGAESAAKLRPALNQVASGQ
jgi:hypothetical protein